MKGNFKEKNLKHSYKLGKLESNVTVMSAIKKSQFVASSRDETLRVIKVMHMLKYEQG